MPYLEQNLKNHTRFDPLYHYFLVPILMMHFISSAWNMSQNFSWATVEALLLAIALVVMGFFVRINPLRAQDRLIRLEEKLRFERLGIADKFTGLSVPQIVALRFAPDAEAGALADQIKSGKLTAPKDIKGAIKNWRADHVRV